MVEKINVHPNSVITNSTEPQKYIHYSRELVITKKIFEVNLSSMTKRGASILFVRTVRITSFMEDLVVKRCVTQIMNEPLSLHYIMKFDIFAYFRAK